MKKTGILLFSIILLIGGITWFVQQPLPNQFGNDRPCPFELESVVQKQLVAENQRARVLYNYKPMLRGHLLIMPKRHVERFEDLTRDEIADIGELTQQMHQKMVKVYGKPDYVLILQNGKFAGQTVPHVHFHMLPRDEEEGIIWVKVNLWYQFLTEGLGVRFPMDSKELKEEIQLLKETLINSGS